MKTLFSTSKFTDRLDISNIRNDSKKWLSELEFIKDEHLFFHDLLNCTPLTILGSNTCDKFEYILAINKSEKRANMLIHLLKQYKRDINLLTILDTESKTLFKHEHKSIRKTINAYKKDFSQLKSQLFDIVKRVKKEEYLRGMINRKDDIVLQPLFS